MPIIPFLRGQTFDQETINAMEWAFITTCKALGLSDGTAFMNEVVARKIIRLAQGGLRNSTALYLAAMKEIVPRDRKRDRPGAPPR